MYLLDTNTVIYIVKGNRSVARNLQMHYHDPMKISIITLMEMYYGAYKSKKVAGNLAKIKTLENGIEIIPLGQEIVDTFGKQKARLEKAGIPLDDFDLAIGCCGLAHNLTLVTNNVKHFKRIEGLKIVNWIE